MADYDYDKIDGAIYSVPKSPKPRKKKPPLIVVMNENCTSCSGSPLCVPECPVDCIHIMMSDDRRPMRVYVDNHACIGCMNCFSFTLRPKNVIKGDAEANAAALNKKSVFDKNGPCPWDAISVYPFDTGAEISEEYYTQPQP